MDDIEGPFYVVGPPYRQIEDGKAVIAPKEHLDKYGPFLFVFEVKDQKGEPVPNAVLDWWQADSEGNYYYDSWTLRGKVKADAHGRVEALSVRPGQYGAPFGGWRAGHAHLKVHGTKGKHKSMTTQAYVCQGNKSELMTKDFANYVRSVRSSNRTTCYSIPAANGGEKYFDFPELPKEDVDTAARVSWWNAKLKEHGIDRQVLAVGYHTLRLSTV
ncbi:Intradiol ring-cleavage dioxygenase [Trametes punicea]|nr:Intradiol ring-cleavage dioxygenase [Trametes punicea]